MQSEQAAVIKADSGWMVPLALSAAVLFWGASYAAAKLAVTAIGPWATMWVRMGLGCLLLLPLIKKLWPRNYQKGDWKLLLALTTMMPCAYFLLESYGISFTTSAQAGVVSALVPVFVFVGSWLFFGQKITLKIGLGLAASMAGVAWLSLAGAPAATASNPLLGNVLMVGASMSGAAYMLILKQLSDRYGSWTLTGLQCLAGLVFFLPGASDLAHGGAALISGEIAFALLFLGSFVTLGAFGCYNWAVSRIPAGQASIWINLVPVVAVIMGWFSLGESFSQMAASGLVIAGVWLCQRR